MSEWVSKGRAWMNITVSVLQNWGEEGAFPAELSAEQNRGTKGRLSSNRLTVTLLPVTLFYIEWK